MHRLHDVQKLARAQVSLAGRHVGHRRLHVKALEFEGNGAREVLQGSPRMIVECSFSAEMPAGEL
jgi:hypothetical protein